jgi:ABC-2 type transport system permease protein
MLAFSFAVMFGVLGVLFHLEVRGSLFALALIGALVGVCALTFGIMMVALCRTFTQVNAVVQVVALGSAFFGGALVPIAALPHWARVVGALTPAYWGMQGLQKVILDGAAIGDVLSSAAVLVAFTIVFAVVIAVRLRFEETKTAWF